MNSRVQVASRLLDSISESLSFDPAKLARVTGHFVTPNGNLVYPVQIKGNTVYVTIPEDYPPPLMLRSTTTGTWSLRCPHSGNDPTSTELSRQLFGTNT